MADNTVFQNLIEELGKRLGALKEIKTLMRELEEDVPMDLEELLLSFKDMRKQVKEGKDKHVKVLLESNDDYADYRKKVQELKEEAANLKLQLFNEAAKLTREHGDLDQTVVVNGTPSRLQTQKEVQVYLNGKIIK